MFKSGISAKKFVEEIRSEVDAAPDIEDITYYRFIDATEQLLYSEIIKEAHRAEADVAGGRVNLASIKPDGGDAIRYEDVFAVYVGNRQFMRSTPVSARVIPYCWWKEFGDLFVNTDETPAVIHYYIRPALKSRDGGENDEISLPVEWLPLLGARVRAEALKLINEDAEAAKWIADYNAILEQFRQFMSSRYDKETGVK